MSLIFVAATVAGSLTFLFKFGSYGLGDGQFNGPRGIVTDSVDNIFVSDHFNRIQKFDNNGNFIATYSGFGVFGGFNLPGGLVFDASGNLLVAECGNNRISEMDSTGQIIKVFGGYGSSIGQFNCPLDIAVSGDGKLIVSDFHNARVQRFYPNGTFIDSFGGGQLIKATYLAIDDENNIYVSDNHNHTVLKFDSNGNHLLTFGGFGSGEGNLHFPDDLEFNERDELLVADHANNRISVFDSNGGFLYAFGDHGTADGKFNLPTIIAVSNNRVYVGDYNNRIQAFSEESALDCTQALPSKSLLWPPNHKFHEIRIQNVIPWGQQNISIMITNIMQDEPVNSEGDGYTLPDGYGIGTASAFLRSERSGRGDGRVYHIFFEAQDTEGNRCSGRVTIGVGKNIKTPPVDQGQLFSSLIN